MNACVHGIATSMPSFGLIKVSKFMKLNVKLERYILER